MGRTQGVGRGEEKKKLLRLARPDPATDGARPLEELFFCLFLFGPDLFPAVTLAHCKNDRNDVGRLPTSTSTLELCGGFESRVLYVGWPHGKQGHGRGHTWIIEEAPLTNSTPIAGPNIVKELGLR